MQPEDFFSVDIDIFNVNELENNKMWAGTRNTTNFLFGLYNRPKSENIAPDYEYNIFLSRLLI